MIRQKIDMKENGVSENIAIFTFKEVTTENIKLFLFS